MRDDFHASLQCAGTPLDGVVVPVVQQLSEAGDPDGVGIGRGKAEYARSIATDEKWHRFLRRSHIGETCGIEREVCRV